MSNSLQWEIDLTVSSVMLSKRAWSNLSSKIIIMQDFLVSSTSALPIGFTRGL